MDNALSQLRGVWGEEVFPRRVSYLQFTGDLECDALELLASAPDSVARQAALHLYKGPFLDGLKLQDLSSGFAAWVEDRRAQLSTAFLTLCESECEAAAASERWIDVGRIAGRGLLYAPAWTEGEHWRRSAAEALQAPGTPVRDDQPPKEPAPSGDSTELIDLPADLPVPLERPATLDLTLPSPALPKPARNEVPVWMSAALAGFLVALVLVVRHIVIRSPNSPPESIRIALPKPGSRIQSLGDWIRTDGRWIYYRYESFMPGACNGGIEAVGNWSEDSWDVGLPIVCLDEAWLAWDVHQFREREALDAETTFCVNFARPQNGTRVWGQHGAQRAPGIEQIAVLSPHGDRNIGFAVARDAQGAPKVVLTNKFPGPRC